MSLSYEKVSKYFDYNTPEGPNIFVVGFPPNQCPYSRLTQEKIQNISALTKSNVFKTITFSDKNKVKQDLNYQGSFPIIFLRECSGKMSHIGGHSELNIIIEDSK